VRVTLCFIAAFGAWMISAPAVRAELLAFYDFNDASSADVAVDTSGHGNDADVIDAVYTDDGEGHTGQAGDRAMDFGDYGNGAYVDVVPAFDGALDSIVDNDQVTLSMWIYGNEQQPAPQWTFYAGPTRQLGAHTPWEDGTIYFDVAGTAADCCGATHRISLNESDAANYMDQWNHYVFVKDEDYTAIYQNGELFIDSGGNAMDPLGPITEFYIGSGPSSDHRSYAGFIDDFGIWDVPLSEEDIVKLYEGTYFGGDVTGDFDASGALDAADIDDLTRQSASGQNPAAYDLNADAAVNDGDVRVWIKDLYNSWVGDANLDGEFNSSDLVAVLATGAYEVDVDATWSSGDFNGDGRANSGDLVAALADGGYEAGPRAAAAVPEPSSGLLMLMTLAWGAMARLGGRR
jgi:hypothetical protein